MRTREFVYDVLSGKQLRDIFFVVRAGSSIIKPHCMHNERTTFSAKTIIAIKLERLELCPEITTLLD